MGSVRTRLSIMMFLQYFVWGAWAVEIGKYMGGVLHFSGAQIGGVYQSTAIAAMLSPLFMGYVADRLMATERLLALLHLIGAGILAYAATVGGKMMPLPGVGIDVEVLRLTMIAYALCYMPTLALTNSISFGNMQDPEKEFPIIRLFGTIGWIVAGLVVGFVLDVDSFLHPFIVKVIPSESLFFAKANFMVLAAISSGALAAFCLALPHTPPKPATTSAPTGDRRGLMTLLASPSFLVFVIASFAICIPLAFYYNLANLYLSEIDAPVPTALQTLGQISEIFFMAAMPWFIMKLGVKRMLAVGMLAWVVRYLCFGTLYFPAILLGLALHGICYDFFFVASQIYVDNKADLSQRSRAQSFIAFVTLGLGMFVGAIAAGWVLDHYPAEQVAVVDESGQPKVVDGKPVMTLLPSFDAVAKNLSVDPNQALDLASLRSAESPESPKIIMEYRAADLAAAVERGLEKRHEDGKQVSAAQWRRLQQHEWKKVWMWPALLAAGALLFFWFGFRDRVAVAR